MNHQPHCKGALDIFQPSPGAALPDHLGLEEPDHRFRQRVVVGIALTAHGGLDPGFCEPLGVANAQVYPPRSLW